MPARRVLIDAATIAAPEDRLELSRGLLPQILTYRVHRTEVALAGFNGSLAGDVR